MREENVVEENLYLLLDCEGDGKSSPRISLLKTKMPIRWCTEITLDVHFDEPGLSRLPYLDDMPDELDRLLWSSPGPASQQIAPEIQHA